MAGENRAMWTAATPQAAIFQIVEDRHRDRLGERSEQSKSLARKLADTMVGAGTPAPGLPAALGVRGRPQLPDPLAEWASGKPDSSMCSADLTFGVRCA